MQEKQTAFGNTPLLFAEKLGRSINVPGLYLKCEGSNPTKTQKDRPASLHVRRAVESGHDTIVVGSCGNYGAAIAYYAYLKHIKARIYIPKSFHSPRLREIEEKYGAKLILVEGMYEDAVEASKRDSESNGWFDGNAGAHPKLGLEAYAEIAYEIVGSTKEVPATVSVPVGNGTTLAGIYHGFSRMKRDGSIDKLPRMVAASTDGGNPVVESFRNGNGSIRDFPRERIRETEINEALVNYHSYDGELAFRAIVDSDGYAEYVTDRELMEFVELLRAEEGVESIPPAASSIAALSHIARKTHLTGINVAVLTG